MILYLKDAIPRETLKQYELKDLVAKEELDESKKNFKFLMVLINSKSTLTYHREIHLIFHLNLVNALRLYLYIPLDTRTQTYKFPLIYEIQKS